MIVAGARIVLQLQQLCRTRCPREPRRARWNFGSSVGGMRSRSTRLIRRISRISSSERPRPHTKSSSNAMNRSASAMSPATGRAGSSLVAPRRAPIEKYVASPRRCANGPACPRDAGPRRPPRAEPGVAPPTKRRTAVAELLGPRSQRAWAPRRRRGHRGRSRTTARHHRSDRERSRRTATMRRAPRARPRAMPRRAR